MLCAASLSACGPEFQPEEIGSIETMLTSTLEAEAFYLPSGNGLTYGEGAASGGRAMLIWSNGTAVVNVQTNAFEKIDFRVRGDMCDGAPAMDLRVNGRTVWKGQVTSSDWVTYSAPVSLPAGTHRLEISFINDAFTSYCDRNLRVDSVFFSQTAAVAPASTTVDSGSTGSRNPFAASRFYVEPNSDAKRQADAWRSSRPADAAQMDKIAQSADSAAWMGEWSGDIRLAVKARVDKLSAAGAVPVLVAYNIPNRDCSGFSAGGARSADDYRAWIRAFASGIGSRRAAVILEPDAIALLDCLSSADRQLRMELLKDATSVLSEAGASVYIDAGHSAWHSATEMAARLRSAGVGMARGFALNVSNFRPTGEAVSYGNSIAGMLGGKSFIIDTSRNGLGSNGEWCNPSGRGLGPRPTVSTGEALVDAFFWVKRPGESDGYCQGGPVAGAWWPEYALGLAQRAGY